MKKFTAYKEIGFDYGHRVPNHASKCRNCHGHRGRLEVYIEGPLRVEDGSSSEGMVMDFNDIKAALVDEIDARFDHVFIKATSDTLFDVYPFTAIQENLDSAILGGRYLIENVGIVQEIRMVPTAENLAYICFQLLSKRINTVDVRVKTVRFWETPTSMAEYSE
jgi:6-pyruvoyltetrahydropterin/6-carboxytetrahydropterin synthase